MHATAVVLRQPLRLSSSSYSTATAQSSSKGFRTSAASICVRPRRRASNILSSGFCDQGHVKYYNSNSAPSLSSKAAAGLMMMMMSASSGKKEKTMIDKAPKKMKKKKQLKLLKGLSRDLSTFSQIGFGLDSDGALLDQVKGNMVSEAAEIMLKQPQKLKAEGKELKRKRKEEKARLKSARMQNSVFDCQMSSSSSSSASSSESERRELIDINNLKSSSQSKSTIMPTITESEPNDVENKCCSKTEGDRQKTNINLHEGNVSSFVVPKKIEVCMGGKCKKSGGGALLDEFQRVVGIEGAVSGCKCMGKCRDGPNVKVSNGSDGVWAGKEARANSLCIGVGLEDVDVIVANFLGENHNQVGFAAA